MKFCWILLCHYVNRSIMDEFLKIKEQLSTYNYIDVVILQDGVEFDYDTLRKKYNTLMLTTDKDYIGNSIFPIIDYSKNHYYDYYIVQEYDCVFTGNYKSVIDNIPFYTFDAMFQSRPQQTKEDWYWKRYSNIPISKNNCNNLLQFYIINKKVIDCIENFYNIGYRGHYEEVVYTAVISNKENLNIKFLDNFFSVYMSWNEKLLSKNLKDIVGIEYIQKKHNAYIKSILKHFENKNTFLHPIKYLTTKN